MKREKSTELTFITWLSLIFFLLFCLSCSPPEPYKIGFLGSLGDSTVGSRNGVILAVEQINREGGISGRTVSLLIKDDQGDPDAALVAVKSFAEQGVAAVIGPMTSEISRIALPLIEQENIAMISPSANRFDFSTPGDIFFRIYPSDRDESYPLADLAYNQRGYRRISVLYDLTNREYAESRIGHFRRSFEDFGGTIVGVTSYTTRDDTDFGLLAVQLSQVDPDAVFILAEPLDVAHICQELKKQQDELPVLITGWSATPELIREGGTAVEGVELFQPYDLSSESVSFKKFLLEYQQRFHEEPELVAFYAYEAAGIALTAIDQRENKESLGNTIARIGDFQGIQDTLSFDRYGVAKRSLLHKKIENGVLISVNQP